MLYRASCTVYYGEDDTYDDCFVIVMVDAATAREAEEKASQMALRVARDRGYRNPWACKTIELEEVPQRGTD